MEKGQKIQSGRLNVTVSVRPETIATLARFSQNETGVKPKSFGGVLRGGLEYLETIISNQKPILAFVSAHDAIGFLESIGIMPNSKRNQKEAFTALRLESTGVGRIQSEPERSCYSRADNEKEMARSVVVSLVKSGDQKEITPEMLRIAEMFFDPAGNLCKEESSNRSIGVQSFESVKKAFEDQVEPETFIPTKQNPQENPEEMVFKELKNVIGNKHTTGQEVTEEEWASIGRYVKEGRFLPIEGFVFDLEKGQEILSRLLKQTNKAKREMIKRHKELEEAKKKQEEEEWTQDEFIPMKQPFEPNTGAIAGMLPEERK